SGAIVLTIVLYLAPQKTREKSPSAPAQVDEYSFSSLLPIAKSALKREENELLTGMEKRLEKEPGNVALLDSLGKQWDRFGQPAMSASYFEMIAEKEPGEKTWLNAAYRFFDAFRLAGDSTLRTRMVAKAI